MAMLNRTAKQQLQEVAAALDASSLPLEMQTRVPQALEKSVAKFRSENRNGAGVTREAGRRIKVLLPRLGHAVRHAQEHPDGSIRREAKRMLRTAQHVSFEELEASAKRFVGLLRKSGHRRNEKRQCEQAWSTTLPDGAELAQVPTPEALRSVGRALDLCVAKKDSLGRMYHRRLARGQSMFCTLAVEGEVVCLLEVDVDGHTIEETSAQGNRAFKPQRKRAFHILEALGATADQESAFADVGAFSPYLLGEPDDRLRLEVNRYRYRVDVFREQRQVVVRESRRRKRWSLFELEAPRGRGLGHWGEVHCGGICLAEFAALLLLPKAAAAIRPLLD